MLNQGRLERVERHLLHLMHQVIVHSDQLRSTKRASMHHGFMPVVLFTERREQQLLE